ncbi:hypothetical protein NHF46_11470 [Arthrobacter alpinus]|nr:hypothetical protein [Arthrobacter alpinus]
MGEIEPAEPKPLHLRLRLHLADLRRRIAEAQVGQAEVAVHRRPDARLLPAVVGTWAAAAVAVVLPGRCLLAVRCCSLPSCWQDSRWSGYGAALGCELAGNLPVDGQAVTAPAGAESAVVAVRPLSCWQLLPR